VLEILESVGTPALDRVESFLSRSGEWDSITRNDFCRYLNVVRSIWAGLPTFIKEPEKDVVEPCLESDTELPELLVTALSVRAGFTLSDTQDPRYQRVWGHRVRFGEVISRASKFLNARTGDEDHIDAVMAVVKAIDVYALEYGMTRGAYDSLRKNYGQVRECVSETSCSKSSCLLITLSIIQPQPYVAAPEEQLSYHICKTGASVPLSKTIHGRTLQATLSTR
jgi:proteasome activator subunit 4